MIEKIKNLQIGEVLEDVDLKNYTTFKVSCTPKCLVKPKDETSLISLLKFLKEENIRYKILGKGSNVVFVGPTFDGVIICLDYFDHLEIDENKIIVGAGYLLIALASKLSKMGYTGLEFASGIPGGVGASVCMNVGAHGSSMQEIVKRVKVINDKLEIEYLENKDLNFSYRDSFFKHHKEYICIEVELYLEKGNIKEIQEKLEEFRLRRNSTQPLEYPSAGSVFRNPENIAAGKIIDDLGFKGKRIGGAKVSDKHANFIINKGNATGRDIKELILKIQKEVKNAYNIDLVLEIELVE